jgi:hypothetical protein
MSESPPLRRRLPLRGRLVVGVLAALALLGIASAAAAAPGERWSGVVELERRTVAICEIPNGCAPDAPEGTLMSVLEQDLRVVVRQEPGRDDLPDHQPYEWSARYSLEILAGPGAGCTTFGVGSGTSPAADPPGTFHFSILAPPIAGSDWLFDVGRFAEQGHEKLRHDVLDGCGVGDSQPILSAYMQGTGPVPVETFGSGIEQCAPGPCPESITQRWTWRLTTLPDMDDDGWRDGIDNCIAVFNFDQEDSDDDGVGDVCDGTAQPACRDGADNDGDGAADWPADIGCLGSEDQDETNPPACRDGRDNDGDARVDFGQDPGCASGDDGDESDGTTPPPNDPPPNDPPPDDTKPCVPHKTTVPYYANHGGTRRKAMTFALDVDWCSTDKGATVRGTKVRGNVVAGWGAAGQWFDKVRGFLTYELKYQSHNVTAREMPGQPTSEVVDAEGRFVMCVGLPGIGKAARLLKTKLGNKIFKLLYTRTWKQIPGFIRTRVTKWLVKQVLKRLDASESGRFARELRQAVGDMAVQKLAEKAGAVLCHPPVWSPRIRLYLHPRGRTQLGDSGNAAQATGYVIGMFDAFVGRG